MTANTQITGGTFKYTSPSNYNTGKDGAEATVHFAVADGASIEDAVGIANLARAEAIRLVTGQSVPFVQAPAPTPAAKHAPQEAQPARTVIAPSPEPAVQGGPSVLTAASPFKPTEDTIIGAEPVVSPLLGGGSPATVTSNAPTSVLGMTAATDAATSAPAASTTSPSTVSAPAADISDGDMKKAIEDRFKELSVGVPKPVSDLFWPKIQQVLGEFIPIGPGIKVYQLDQAQRAAYLDRLKALTLQ